MISAINSVNSSPAFGNHMISVMRPSGKGTNAVKNEILTKCRFAGKKGVKFVGESPFAVPENVAKHFVNDSKATYYNFSYPVENITKTDRDFLHRLGQVFITRA